MKKIKKSCSDGIVYKTLENSGKQQLVLIHSFPASSRLFTKAIKYFSNDFDIFTFDMPGFGESSPIDFQDPNEFFEKVTKFMHKNISENAIIYACSFGGIITMEYLKNHSASNIILESAPLSSDSIHTHELALVDFIKDIVNTFQLEPFLNKNRKKISNAMVFLYDHLKNGSTTYNKAEERFYIEHIDFETFFKLADYMENFNVTNDIRYINRNGLFIYDENDPTVDFETSEKYLAKKRGCKFISTNLYTHVPSLNYPKQVFPIINDYLLSE